MNENVKEEIQKLNEENQTLCDKIKKYEKNL